MHPVLNSHSDNEGERDKNKIAMGWILLTTGTKLNGVEYFPVYSTHT